MFSKHRGEFYLVLGALLFSFNGVIITLVLDHMTAYRLGQVRAIGSFLLLFTVFYIKARKSLAATKREVPTLLLYGVFGFAMVQVIWSIVCYPVVVFLSRYVLDLHKPAMGEVDAYGRRM